MKDKTCVYLSSAAAGTVIAFACLYLYGFIRDLDLYLTYRNAYDGEAHGEKSVYVNIGEMVFYGCISAVLLVALFFVIRFWAKKMKYVKKKLPTIAISVFLVLLSMLAIGYIIVLR